MCVIAFTTACTLFLASSFLRIASVFTFALWIDTFNFSVGDNWTKIGVILSVLFKTFFDVLDDDIALVYSYLCNEYFINHIKISNIEIYDKVNEYLGLNWSNDKINKILLQLENKRVIEFVDGVLKVKDKIYFE